MMASIADWCDPDMLGVLRMLTNAENTTVEEYSSLLVSAATAARSVGLGFTTS